MLWSGKRYVHRTHIPDRKAMKTMRRELTTLQQRLLNEVCKRPGQWPRSYKGALGWPRGGITRTIAALVRDGYLEPDPDALFPTEKGKEAAE
jgi:DNA-binding MarR family transcriptional regulator